MCDESTQESQSTQNTSQTSQQGYSQTVTPQMSPEEKEMQQLQLSQYKEIQPFQTATQKQGYQFINQLLAGARNLPGFYGNVGEGISDQMAGQMAGKAVQDLMPRFQQSGIMDSGVAASVAGRTAGDIRRQVAEYNIGNKLALMNLALSGSTQIQQPSIAQQGLLNQQLAGVRAVTTTGTSSGSTLGYGNTFGNQIYTPSPLQTGGSLMSGFGGLMMGAGMMGARF